MNRQTISVKHPVVITLIAVTCVLVCWSDGWRTSAVSDTSPPIIKNSPHASHPVASPPGQWMQTAGPTGGTIKALLINGTDIFAGTDSGGIFRSTDNGTNWSAINNGLTNRVVYALAANGNALFAGTLGGGVFRSTDNGANWSAINNGLTNRSISSLAVNGSALFAGTYGDYAFRSIDNGATWTKVNNGLITYSTILTLAVNGGVLFAGTYGGYVFRSTDNGANWTQFTNGFISNRIYAFAANGTTLFAGAESGGVFRSTDNGANWTQVNNGLTNNTVLALAVNGGTLFAGISGGGIFRSTDNGANWSPINNGLTNNTVLALAVNGSNLFAGTDGGGVLRSTNNGDNWSSINNGLTASRVYAFTVNGSTLFAGTFGGGVFRSTDNGANWSVINNSLTNLYINALVVNGIALYAGTNGDGVFRSTDNGANWIQVNNGLPSSDDLFIRALTVNGSALLAGTSRGIFRSTDNGASWSAIFLGGKVYALAVNSSHLFAGTEFGVVRSEDNGANWSYINNGLANREDRDVRALTANGNTLFAGTNGGGVFRSSDSGANWIRVNSGLTSGTVRALRVNGNTLFAGTFSDGVFDGVFRSTDNGATWTPFNDGLTNTYILSFAVSGTRLFAGTYGGGVFLIDIGASGCSYSLGSASQSFGSAGGSGNVSVTTDSGCAWTATSNASWITITSGGSGNGSGTVNYAVAANTSGSSRSGTMTIAGQTFTATQAADCPIITLSPTTLPNGTGGVAYNQTLAASGGTSPYTFAVTAGTLPNGLTLSTGGAISGTPNVANTFNFTVTATDANGCTGARSYTVNITIVLGAQVRPLYVLKDSTSGNQIYGYAVNEAAGTLALLAGFPVSTGGNGANTPNSEQLAIDRANQRLYALNRGSGLVSAYSIDPATGALTPMPFSPINLGSGNWATIAVHPSGSPLVIGRGSDTQFLSYQITATTATAAAGSPYNTGSAQGFSTAFSQDGSYVYTGGNNLTTAVAGFSVNAATGVLTALPGSPFESGAGLPQGYATDVAGRLFIVNATSPQVRVFTIANGLPTTVLGNPFPSGLTEGTHGVLHPNGFYLVADRVGNRVGVYRIGGSGSATTLAAVTGSPFAAGGAYTDVLALNQTGAFLFAANGDSRNLTTFGVNPTTGALTTLSIQPADTLGGSGRLTGMAYLAPPCSAITLSPTTLPSGTVGTTYNQTVMASPAPSTGSYTFSVTAGALPAGLSLNATTGAITGAPTTGGTANFTITALSFGPCGGSQSYALTIQTSVNCPTVSALNPLSGVVGSSVTITGANFTGVSAVRFANNVGATFTVNSDSQITATVPNGAVTGPIMLVKPGCGNAQTAPFAVVPGSVISGAVRYCITGEPVATVTVTATAVSGATAGTATGADGRYAIGGLATDFYSVAPAKTGEVRGLSAYDAALVAQHVANGGTPIFDRCRTLAADADRSGVLTLEDARLILRQALGLADAGQTGKWRFDPDSRPYAPLNGDQINQNYDAVLIGDVSGNWARAGALAVNSVEVLGDGVLLIRGRGFQEGLSLLADFPDGGRMRLGKNQLQETTAESFVARLKLAMPGLWLLRVINPDGFVASLALKVE